MSFCVLNASFPVFIEKELDNYVDYRQGIDSCFSGDKIIKKCVSWHSLSVAHETEFFVYKKQGWEGCLKYDSVLVLVRDDINHVEPLIKKLKLMKKKVSLGFHENASHFLQLSQDLNWLGTFKKLLDSVDYYWNANNSLTSLFSELSKTKVLTTSHAVPHDFCNKFKVKTENRKGIIVGTRTFSQWIPRNTLVSLASASYLSKKYGEPVTYVSGDNIPRDHLQAHLKDLGFCNINVIEGGMSYEDWLKTIAKHKCLIHADCSETLGQVVADSCSVGVPAYGGSSYNNVIASTSETLASTTAKIEEDFKNDFRDPIFNFELLKFETSYETIKKKHEHFVSRL